LILAAAALEDGGMPAGQARKHIIYAVNPKPGWAR